MVRKTTRATAPQVAPITAALSPSKWVCGVSYGESSLLVEVAEDGVVTLVGVAAAVIAAKSVEALEVVRLSLESAPLLGELDDAADDTAAAEVVSELDVVGLPLDVVCAAIDIVRLAAAIVLEPAIEALASGDTSTIKRTRRLICKILSRATCRARFHCTATIKGYLLRIAAVIIKS